MSSTSVAIREVDKLNTLALRDQWVNKLHPLVKFVITVVYIAVTVSFHKYDVMGVLGMMIYPLALFMLADLSFRECMGRIRLVLPLVIFIGIFNPIFDKNVVVLGGSYISAGFLSMITLVLKGFFAILASYILVATTTIEQICYALRIIKVPKVLTNQFLLTYRYISLFLSEVGRTMDAYKLRAPKQKGVHISAWGSLVGQMLLRSINRAGEVYESMLLRGYNGEFYISRDGGRKINDFVFLFLWLTIIAVFRVFPVLVLVGDIF